MATKKTEEKKTPVKNTKNKKTDVKKTNTKKGTTTKKETIKKVETVHKAKQEKVEEKKVIVTKPENRTNKKTAKKEKRPEVYHTKNAKSDEITKLVELILVILVIFAAFYLITIWVTKSKNNSGTSDPTEEKQNIIQYDEILLGKMLDQKADEYYVLAMSDDDDNQTYYATYISTYKGKENSLRIYTSYIDNVFNQKYKAEDVNLKVENSKDLKMKTTTLFRIKDHKVEETFEGADEVKNKLAELIK